MKLTDQINEDLYCFYEQNDCFPSRLHISRNQLMDLKNEQPSNLKPESYMGIEIEVQDDGEFYFS